LDRAHGNILSGGEGSLPWEGNVWHQTPPPCGKWEIRARMIEIIYEVPLRKRGGGRRENVVLLGGKRKRPASVRITEATQVERNHI